MPPDLLAQADEVIEQLLNIRYWPKADIWFCTAHGRFAGQSGQQVGGKLICASGTAIYQKNKSHRTIDANKKY